MKPRTIVVLFAALSLLILASTASAQGQDTDTLQNAGWQCMIAGPHNWVHCFPPGAPMTKGMATGVKVFDCHDDCTVILDKNGDPTGAFSGTGHPFLGTELLLADSVYGGQPCTTDNGNPYEPVNLGPLGLFRACHHFEASDH